MCYGHNHQPPTLTDEPSPSLATIFVTICQYGIPNVGIWLLELMEVMFWLYIGFSILVSAGLYLTLWSTQ